MKKKLIMGTGILIILGILSFVIVSNSAPSYPALESFEGEITIFKEPTCGCCGIYADYLEKKGKLSVNIIEDASVGAERRKFNIPDEIKSCHTTIIGDYFVEGHVPLEAISKLIIEKPDIAGIALAGMPSGTPGMPGPKKQQWVIHSVNHDGSYEEFMRI